jgi:tRNA (guanosine-2'-O-)-methyltransferase
MQSIDLQTCNFDNVFNNVFNNYDNIFDNYDNIFHCEKKRSNLRDKANASTKQRCNTLICVLENPSNIQNVGAIIRNINALGVAKLYVVDGKNIFQGKSWKEIRDSSSMRETSVSAIKWTFIKTFKTSLECFNHLNNNNFVSVGTSPHIKGKNNIVLSEGTFTHKKLAIWFGNETSGLTDFSVDNCSSLIQIPMFGIIESFNLATSTGIVFYEICKQRRNYSKTKE